MSRHDIVVIGGSAGSTQVLNRVLEALPEDLPAAIAVASHMPSGKISHLAEMLTARSALPVTQAVDGQPVVPGQVFVAAPDRHLLLVGDVIRLGAGPRENMTRPAIDPLFRSAALSHGGRVQTLGPECEHRRVWRIQLGPPVIRRRSRPIGRGSVPDPKTMIQKPILSDPRSLYPSPPFPEQPQPAPGLAARMVPEPDHGEASYVGSGRLAGRKALITGGDSGIGRAAAIAFAREGADVAIGFLPAERSDAEAVIALIEAEGRRAVAMAGDVTDEAWCRRMVDETVERLGGLDILVVNAGHQQTRGGVGAVSSEDFDVTMKTNLYALHWTVQAAVPHLPAGAAIITTASVQAYDPSAHLLDYATTKAGIVAYTKALAAQLIERGIRANVVAPGPFWTVLQPSGGQTQEKVRSFGAKSAYGRPGQPAEIAPVYVLLASSEASYITGEVYGVTGGAGVA